MRPAASTRGGHEPDTLENRDTRSQPTGAPGWRPNHKAGLQGIAIESGKVTDSRQPIGYDEAKVEAVGLTLSNTADDLTTALVAGEATASVVIGEVDESGTSSEDSSATSSDDSSVPGTSDAGIFAIVAVAVVAVLGAAVVIRKRA